MSLYELSKVVIDAAAEAGVQHVVYSSLPPSSEINDGLVSIDYFDEKSAIANYIRSNSAFVTTAVVSPGWYMENFLNKEFCPILGGFPFNKDDSGVMTLRMPSFGGNGAIHLLSVEQDFGDFVHGVLLNPEKHNGSLIQSFSKAQTPQSIVEAFTQVTGTKARYEHISLKEFPTYGSKGLLGLKKEMLYCQYAGGRFYGEPTDGEPAAALKVAATAARGRHAPGAGEKATTSILDFMNRHFGTA